MKRIYEKELTLEELAGLPDEDIDLSEMPEAGDDFWKNARLVAPGERKQLMSLRVDPDVVAWFKGQGKGYQSRMNAALRAYMNAHR